MSIARFNGAIALVAILSSVSCAAGQGDPVDEKNWLNDKTWPALVAQRRLEITGKDNAVTKLLKERFNAVQDELRSRYVYWLQDAESLPEVYDAARRASEARLEAGGPGSDKLTILKEKVAFAKVVERQAERLVQKFNRPRQNSDKYCATYFRANSELELLRAEIAAEQPPRPGEQR